MKVHELKTVQPFFDMIFYGRKRFELRKNDRDFNFDDILVLREYEPGHDRYTGCKINVRVTSMLQNYPGLEEGYCILSISDPL